MTAEQEEAARKCAHLAREIEYWRGRSKSSRADVPRRILAALELELGEAQAALKALTPDDEAEL